MAVFVSRNESSHRLLVAALWIMSGSTAGANGENSILLWSADFGGASGALSAPPDVIASAIVTLDFEDGDTAVLSSTTDGLGKIEVDDQILVNGTNVCVGQTIGNPIFLGVDPGPPQRPALQGAARQNHRPRPHHRDWHRILPLPAHHGPAAEKGVTHYHHHTRRFNI